MVDPVHVADTSRIADTDANRSFAVERDTRVDNVVPLCPLQQVVEALALPRIVRDGETSQPGNHTGREREKSIDSLSHKKGGDWHLLGKNTSWRREVGQSVAVKEQNLQLVQLVKVAPGQFLQCIIVNYELPQLKSVDK